MTVHTQIAVSISAGTGILCLARPEARNALTDIMLAEAGLALQEFEADGSITAMVLTGDDNAFCAGGDLKGTASSSMPAFDKYRHRHTASVWHDFMRLLGRCTKPVIAAVEGHALGGGLELLLRCDFAVGSATARLGMTEARLGLFPILGGAWLLTRAVGERKARELAYSGRRIGAEEALALGILNHVTPPGQAFGKALEIAQEIGTSSPLSVMALKQAINRAPSQTFEQALDAGGDLSALLMFSEDRKEGLAAFLERRAPEFAGK